MTPPNNRDAPTVLITGAAGGIGHALIRTFQEAGYRIIATDRVPNLEELDSVQYVCADLSRIAEDNAYAETIFEEIRQILKGNGLNALINNAAVQLLGGTEILTREDWRQSFNINVLAPFLFIQALLPALQSVTGCVVNIGSIHAHLTKKNFVAYATTKAAMAGMTRSLAVDLGARVRINAIEPAAIETEMLRAGFKNNPEAYRQLEQCHPQQRIGHPGEVARLALAIVSGGMEFLHGTCIGLNGGIASRLYDPN